MSAVVSSPVILSEVKDLLWIACQVQVLTNAQVLTSGKAGSSLRPE